MANLETNYVGLKLKNPVIAASSGITNSVAKIKELQEAGVGAVVLKSLFEEQIMFDVNRAIIGGQGSDYPEAMDYIKQYTFSNSVAEYLELIRKAKASAEIPVIASINCYSANEWVDFAMQVESAGADALELNLFMVNTDKNSDAGEQLAIYLKVAKLVSRVIKIPVVMKLSPYFANLVSLVNQLTIAGAKGVVLFNRFYEPDIDLDKMVITSAGALTTSSDMHRTLRWVAIVSSKISNVDISASTGIHDGEAVIKQILAGAKTVQVCSSIYKSGPVVVTRMVEKLSNWMDEKGFSSIDEIRGLMSYSKVQNTAAYERVQFMKYFAKIE